MIKQHPAIVIALRRRPRCWPGACSGRQWPPTKAVIPSPTGPFKPEMDSLKQYQCPEWFRDAKFGIWAHWGPQAVPMDGDWYARGMYEEGNGHYKYHLAHYGHPSELE